MRGTSPSYRGVLSSGEYMITFVGSGEDFPQELSSCLSSVMGFRPGGLRDSGVKISGVVDSDELGLRPGMTRDRR